MLHVTGKECCVCMYVHDWHPRLCVCTHRTSADVSVYYAVRVHGGAQVKSGRWRLRLADVRFV